MLQGVGSREWRRAKRIEAILYRFLLPHEYGMVEWKSLYVTLENAPHIKRQQSVKWSLKKGFCFQDRALHVEEWVGLLVQ